MAHKRGKRQRYEEARLLKRGEVFSENTEPCPECGALPGDDHKSWCAAEEAEPEEFEASGAQEPNGTETETD
jgi:hypothetical protein